MVGLSVARKFATIVATDLVGCCRPIGAIDEGSFVRVIWEMSDQTTTGVGPWPRS